MSKEIEKIEEHTEFEHFELDERLLRGVVFMGYERPTPIQEQAIPPALKGLDVMGAAQTGTVLWRVAARTAAARRLPRHGGTRSDHA